MTADTDLDALVAGLRRSPREDFNELEAARRAAEAALPPESTIIPMPELPPLWPHPRSCIVRFLCALECGWAHEENAYECDREPVRFPLGGSLGDVDRVLAEHAEQQGVVLRARVEAAIRGHFAEAHPGQEPPERSAW
ncbi:hypothetical protein ACFVH9_07490 [Streptomyces hirsutus]|uniref:hypothetical protein n=1 Tax=Streptomyces hirsutus TaxID=35620 RepID=UPI003637FA0D